MFDGSLESGVGRNAASVATSGPRLSTPDSRLPYKPHTGQAQCRAGRRFG